MLRTDEKIENYLEQGYWTNEVITDRLDAVAAATPDKIAAIDPRGELSYGELKRLSRPGRAGPAGAGRAARRRGVSFQLPNWTEFLVVHFAVTRIGAVNNPLIPIYRDREVGFMVGLARSKVIIVPREFRGYDYPAMVDRLRGDWPDLQHVLVVDGPSGRSSSTPRGSSGATRPSWPRCARTRTTSRC